MVWGWRQPLLLCLVCNPHIFGAAQDVFNIAICSNRFCNCTASDSSPSSCSEEQVYYNHLFDKKCLANQAACTECNDSASLCMENFYVQLWKRYPEYVIAIGVAFLLGNIVLVILVCWTCCCRKKKLQRTSRSRRHDPQSPKQFDALKAASPAWEERERSSPDTKAGSGSIELPNRGAHSGKHRHSRSASNSHARSGSRGRIGFGPNSRRNPALTPERRSAPGGGASMPRSHSSRSHGMRPGPGLRLNGGSSSRSGSPSRSGSSRGSPRSGSPPRSPRRSPSRGSPSRGSPSRSGSSPQARGRSNSRQHMDPGYEYSEALPQHSSHPSHSSHSTQHSPHPSHSSHSPIYGDSPRSQSSHSPIYGDSPRSHSSHSPVYAENSPPPSPAYPNGQEPHPAVYGRDARDARARPPLYVQATNPYRDTAAAASPYGDRSQTASPAYTDISNAYTDNSAPPSPAYTEHVVPSQSDYTDHEYTDHEQRRQASKHSPKRSVPPSATPTKAPTRPRHPMSPAGKPKRPMPDEQKKNSRKSKSSQAKSPKRGHRHTASHAIDFVRLTIDKKRIGLGGKGVVHSGLLDGKRKVAIKKLDVENKAQYIEIMQEASMLTKLNHRYVVRMYGVSQFASHRQTKSSPGSIHLLSPHGLHSRAESLAHLTQSAPAKKMSMYIVMELCDSSLKEMLQQPGSDPDFDAHALMIALQVAQTMAYLHDQGVCHRDLKPGNILLCNGDVRLADFGLSKNVMGADKKATLEIGTPAYMPPELFVDTELDGSGAGSPAPANVDPYKSDIYAFAIILWALFHRRMPYEKLSAFSIIYKVKMQGIRPPIHEHTSEDITALLTACWHKNQNERPSFHEIFARLTKIKESGSWFFRSAYSR